jgi:hypothetical protein
MPRGVAAFVVAAGVGLLLAASSSASPRAGYGIQDDAWLMYGPGTLTQRLTTLDRLGVRLVRFTVRWDQVAPTRPAAPRDPGDPAYKWGQFEVVLRGLRENGVTPLVTLYGSPRWANGGHTPNWLPQRGFADFAHAAARRFPWVRMWTMWNEPNGRTFAVPVSPAAYVRRVLNPGYAALHAASASNVVAGGVTSPRKTPSGLSPLEFMAGMRAAGARLDAYAQNPYPVSPSETPTSATCARCTYMTLGKLPSVRATVTHYFGASTQLWLTEYGYQTNPPDALFGVSWAKQAAYLTQAFALARKNPRIDMMLWFLLKDEPNLAGWQSGLLTITGQKKPAYAAFMKMAAAASPAG